MPIYKRCCRCGKRLLASETCECVKKRHTEYKKYRTDKKEEEFYSSHEWLATKPIIKDKYKCLDIYSLYVLGKIEYGYTTHHVVELKEDWSKRLDIENLIYLSESNHQLVHKAYKECDETKKNMQKLLFSVILRWEREQQGGI